MKDKHNMGKLKICKASAGSGKTFTLAVEYIKHLVMNPSAYRRILAVTFTNKATAEMKQRIVSQLYGISRQLDDSKDYLSKIVTDETITAWYARQIASGKTAKPVEDIVRDNCRKALSMIIHDYHRFRIETIDSFFQTIIRELAHDLSLTANLKVELDKDGALKEGVSRVIDAIVDDKKVERNVLDYVDAKMDENKNWTVNSELEKFGENIFNENFLKFGKVLREKLKDSDFLKNYRRTIEQHKQYALQPILDYGRKFLEICDAHGLTVDNFIQKSNGAFGFFQKLSKLDLKNPSMPNVTKKVLSFTDSADSWSKDKNVVAIVEQEQLVRLLNETISKHQEVDKIISTVVEINKLVNQLALINTISNKVNDALNERGEFLLSNTNHFLNEMIAESDVPFIYERTGTHFDHIMIDEFQDTSVLQWENFKPLIKNCLDSNHECLVVGDVKQSIYRWRNGEWSILNGMNEDPDLKDFVNPDPLDTNYRSSERVVRFNNAFFEKASRLLSESYAAKEGGNAEDILKAYEECRQKIKKQDGGYVRVELKKESQAADDMEEWQCRRIAANVEELLKAGVPQSQIAILVRKNLSVSAVCDYFDHKSGPINGEQVKVVSMEAYRLDSSPAVSILVLALKMLQNPDDKTYKAMLAYHYQSDVMGNESVSTDFHQLFATDNDSLNAALPEALTEHADELVLIPLYELCERLYTILRLDRIADQDAYLFSFYDHVNKFLEGNITDTEHFLTLWDDKICAQTINDGGVEGIRIMSIHKSKGLEFHSVIIPFATWEVTDGSNNNKNLIWCKPDVPPFDALPLCPLKIGKALGSSIFAEDYRAELLKQYVDNINVLYVAMTRASENLIVISHPQKGKAKDDLVSMYEVLRQAMPEEWTALPADDMDFEAYEECGSRVCGFREKHKDSKNVMLQKPVMRSLSFISGESRGEFRQSNKSKRFIQGDELDGERTKYLDEGILFHAILSEIQTLDDVERAIDRLDIEGCFESRYHREDVKRLVERAYQDPRSSVWFDSKWTVINENAIVFKDSDGKIATCRPDRVITDGNETLVIDYKTGIYRLAHEEQVRRYMELLRQMGYPNVKGFLWYIRQQSIVEIRC